MYSILPGGAAGLMRNKTKKINVGKGTSFIQKDTGWPFNWTDTYYWHSRCVRYSHNKNLGSGGSVYFFPRFSDSETGTTHRPQFPSHSLHMAVFGRNFTQLGWDEPKPPFVFLSISVFAVSWSHGLSAGKLFAAAPLPPTWLTDIWLSWYTGINQSSYQHVVFSLRPFISSFCLPVLQPLSKQS